MKTLRDYINLIESNKQGVAEATPRHFGPKGAGTELARQIRANGELDRNKQPKPTGIPKKNEFNITEPKAKIQVKKDKGVAEGFEQINELRDRMYQYIRSIVPTWPEYVVQDWLYKGRGKNKNYNVNSDVKGEILEMIADAGLSPNTNPWQLVPNMKFTMDMFGPVSKKNLIGRAGGTSDLGMGIPKDKERHSTQAALIQKGGVSKEPAILIKRPEGYDLLEGWHRTIQHFHMYPNGYTGPAYVAVAQGQQGVAEGKRRDGE